MTGKFKNPLLKCIHKSLLTFQIYGYLNIYKKTVSGKTRSFNAEVSSTGVYIIKYKSTVFALVYLYRLIFSQIFNDKSSSITLNVLL